MPAFAASCLHKIYAYWGYWHSTFCAQRETVSAYSASTGKTHRAGSMFMLLTGIFFAQTSHLQAELDTNDTVSHSCVLTCNNATSTYSKAIWAASEAPDMTPKGICFFSFLAFIGLQQNLWPMWWFQGSSAGWRHADAAPDVGPAVAIGIWCPLALHKHSYIHNIMAFCVEMCTMWYMAAPLGLNCISQSWMWCFSRKSWGEGCLGALSGYRQQLLRDRGAPHIVTIQRVHDMGERVWL